MLEKEYDVEFEQVYLNLSQEDFNKLEEINKKIDMKQKIKYISLALGCLEVLLVLLAVTFFLLLYNSIGQIIAGIIIFLGIATLVIYNVIFIHGKWKKYATSREHDNIDFINEEVSNKFIMLFENPDDIDRTARINELNKLYNTEYGFTNEIDTCFNYYYDTCSRCSVRKSVATYCIPGYTFSNFSSVNLKNDNKLILANVQNMQCGSGGLYLRYELFGKVELKKFLGAKSRIKMIGSKRTGIRLDSTYKGNLITTELCDKLLEYFKEYPFEIIIVENKIYVRVAVKDFYYYTTKLAIKDYFYEIYKSRKFLLKIVDELLEVIENV